MCRKVAGEKRSGCQSERDKSERWQIKRDYFLERPHVRDRLRGVYCLNLSTDCAGEPARVLRAAYSQDHALVRMLCEGNVELGQGRQVETTMMNIADDADNICPNHLVV